MKKGWFVQMLATYDYHGLINFFESLAPSVRYSLTKPLLVLSVLYPGITAFTAMFFPAVEATLGISGPAFIAMSAAFIMELASGLAASHISKQQFSSLRLSRFTFKVFIYLVIIAVPYHWQENFLARHKEFMAAVFDWLQSVLIVQIAFENIISILENLAVITGKDKTAWINKIKDKLTSLYNG
ncbi:phage holin family protein [Mucilaginibacter rubeus]|uniref:Uncharacterized protein n=1 Tax=Mucilaginibacter rubeus TaxID=2027860 RepID=A0A5C1I695_9SPHI|nr:phage holin family protein [Mucilaginibacter rubeus]QEM13475.1 hypothetical protein DEO27_026845 [Mucilaginibacter rubeus]